MKRFFFNRTGFQIACSVLILTLASCGQNYNSSTNDNGGELGIDCATEPRLCAAVLAMKNNHCFECHSWSGYKTDASWIAAGLVTKDNPGNSKLVQQLKNAGGTMPQNYSPMSSDEYDAVKTWIQNM
ncbi:MAG: hypothetical protein ACXVA9_09115 [Bdellovibrionales bacterium]